MTLEIPLSPDAETRLRTRAAAAKLELSTYVAQLVEEVALRPSLDEILAPVRADFARTTKSEEQLRNLASQVGAKAGMRSGPSGEVDSSWEQLEPYIWTDPERLGGKPCFRGTRVPIRVLFEHLRAGDPLEAFLEGFPPVTREQAVAVINLAEKGLLHELHTL